MIYLFVVILILIGVYRYDYCQANRGRLLFYCLLMILFICVAGFRYRMGNDSVAYEFFFNSKRLSTIEDLKWSDFKSIRYMPGFVILSSLSKTIYPDFMVVQFAVSTILNCVVFRFFWKNTRHCFFAVLLYAAFQYITLNMEVMREALSVSFFLLAWPFFRDGKWWYYFPLALCAFLCHVSAFIMFLLPLCLLPGIRWFFQYGKRTIIISVVLLAISVMASFLFFRVIESIAVTESMMERTEAYANNGLGETRVNIVGAFSYIFRYVLYPMLALYSLNKYHSASMESRDMQRMQIMCMLSIYVAVLSIGIFIISRYNNYFIFFAFVFISDWAFSTIRKNKKKVRLSLATWVIIFVPLFAYNSYSTYFLNVNKEGTLKAYMKYYPYKNAIEKEMDPNREKVFKYMKRYR